MQDRCYSMLPAGGGVRWGVRGLVFASALWLAACSEADGPAASEPRPTPLAPDTSSFDVSYRPETVVVDTATIESKLTNPRAADGIYRFDPSASSLAQLSAGQVLVLTGVDLVKVTSVEVTEEAIVLTTEPATLLDAVSDANVAWDIGADMSLDTQADTGGSMLRPLASPTRFCTPDNPQACEGSFNGTLGNLKTTQKLETVPGGGLNLSFTIEYPLQVNSVLKVAVEGALRSFRHEGSVVIESGALSQAVVRIKDVDLEIDIHARAVAMGVSDDTFKFPVSVTFPFQLGPIPAYLTVGGSIALYPSLSDKSSFKARVKFHVNGTTGLTITGNKVTGTGALVPEGATPPAVSEVDYISTVDAGFGVLTEFPRVGLGIGIAKLASLEGYVSAKEEIVMNQTINLGGLGLISGNCATINANVGAYAGGSFRLAGVELEAEQQLFGAVREVLRKGNVGGKADDRACKD